MNLMLNKTLSCALSKHFLCWMVSVNTLNFEREIIAKLSLRHYMLRLLNTLVSVQITPLEMAFHADGGALKQLAITPELVNQHQRSNQCPICTCEVSFKGKVICKLLLIERMLLLISCQRCLDKVLALDLWFKIVFGNKREWGGRRGSKLDMFSKKWKYYFFDLTANCCNIIIFFTLLEIPVVLTQGLEGGKEMRRFLLLESSRKTICFLFPVTDLKKKKYKTSLELYQGGL